MVIFFTIAENTIFTFPYTFKDIFTAGLIKSLKNRRQIMKIFNSISCLKIFQ